MRLSRAILGAVLLAAASATAQAQVNFDTIQVRSQQLANEPDATYETGLFTSLTDQALDMFVHQYAPPPGRARR